MYYWSEVSLLDRARAPSPFPPIKAKPRRPLQWLTRSLFKPLTRHLILLESLAWRLTWTQYSAGSTSRQARAGSFFFAEQGVFPCTISALSTSNQRL